MERKNNMYTGTFKVDGKIWDKINGTVIVTPKAGTLIEGDAISTVNDIGYMHLTKPMAGYTKTSFLIYTSDTQPPPPPAPIPTHVVEVVIDGVVVLYKDLF